MVSQMAAACLHSVMRLMGHLWAQSFCCEMAQTTRNHWWTWSRCQMESLQRPGLTAAATLPAGVYQCVFLMQMVRPQAHHLRPTLQVQVHNTTRLLAALAVALLSLGILLRKPGETVAT